MKVALVITTFNRPSYLEQTLDSIRKLITYPDEIIIVDDASADQRTLQLLDDFNGVRLIKHFTNTGIKGAISTGCYSAFEHYECEVVINLDGDAIVKPDFIEKLLLLKHAIKGIVSGFNCVTKRNPIVGEGNTEGGLHYVVKPHINGINMCFNKEEYKKYIEPSLKKEGNWDYNTSMAYNEAGYNFSVLSPSVVQHIGLESSMGHTAGGVKADIAQDYE